MKCGDSRQRLLEEEPQEIAAALGDPAEDGSGTAWQAHVRECSACADLARRILAERDRLAAGLDSVGAARPLADALSAAVRDSAARRRRGRRSAWGAAAALAAGVLAIRSLQIGGGPAADPTAPGLAFEGRIGLTVEGPEIEALLDESVLVLETDDDEVVVFWFYQGRGE